MIQVYTLGQNKLKVYGWIEPKMTADVLQIQFNHSNTQQKKLQQTQRIQSLGSKKNFLQ